MAWHLAMLQRVDGHDFPTLDDMTGDGEPPPPQTPEQLRENLKAWATALGAKMDAK